MRVRRPESGCTAWRPLRQSKADATGRLAGTLLADLFKSGNKGFILQSDIRLEMKHYGRWANRLP